MRRPRDQREAERQRALQDLHVHEQPAPVHPIGEQAADHREEQQRTELSEVQEPDVEAAVCQREPYAPRMTFCIHVPMFDANVPT